MFESGLTPGFNESLRARQQYQLSPERYSKSGSALDDICGYNNHRCLYPAYTWHRKHVQKVGQLRGKNRGKNNRGR